ncbi:pyridoxamine 5'-phosphate oxidase family protein [Hoeflea sp.]|uniref:FAD-binding oxidoreductase n=1 Tax=Hoeflea sp. TaxID=1940281 RepID=UPI003B01FB0A
MLDKQELPERPSPFHDGEVSVQERLGARSVESWARQAIRDHMPEQHRTFYSALPYVVVAARDAQERPWATVLTGPAGFMHTPDPHRIMIDAHPPIGDALEYALKAGSDVGILGIELATRRRNRVNGKLAKTAGSSLMVDVDQTFGNCPQYIRERGLRQTADHQPGEPIRGKALTGRQKALVSAADTFFIASGYRGRGDNPAFGMDVSHRGGEAGFVEIADDNTIRFPDYAGNNLYNTIGNIVADPRAGFLFIEFSTGSLLQLSGRARVDWDTGQTERTQGTGRLVTLEIDAIVELPGALPLRWDTDAGSVRSLRLIDKRDESADVASFVFEARDGGPLPDFTAGQHLPLALAIAGIDGRVNRTYSLSGAPGKGTYRISVKRETQGLASRYLHDCLEPGAIIEAGAPGGDFTAPAGSAPLVLVSAGVGVTPMVSMLHELAERGLDQPVYFVHGVRDGDHHPFAEEVKALALKHAGLELRFVYSRPLDKDRESRAFDAEGRIDAKMLAALADTKAARFMICGPLDFMADITAGLVGHGVSENRIFTETFGPSQVSKDSLRR